MNVLVTVASKHGVTAEIGEAIARVLRDARLRVTLAEPGSVSSVTDYDAVVLGSAVYAGRWLADARDFADRHERDLVLRRVWLFSSGPIGDPPMPEEGSPDLAAIAKRVGARSARSFAGSLDRSRLGFVERTLTRALKAPEGDFRDWEEIRTWAHEIACDLVGEEVSA